LERKSRLEQQQTIKRAQLQQAQFQAMIGQCAGSAGAEIESAGDETSTGKPIRFKEI
jgi:hypothetical protein